MAKSAQAHLAAAIDALRTDRANMAAEMGRIDEMIASLESLALGAMQTPSVPSSSGRSGSNSEQPYVGPSITEVAMRIAERGAVFSLTEVVDAVAEAGSDAKYGSISSVLSRMVKDGKLRKVDKRGHFTIAPVEDPNNAEGPATGGAFDLSTRQQQEGVENDADHAIDHHRTAMTGD